MKQGGGMLLRPEADGRGRDIMKKKGKKRLIATGHTLIRSSQIVQPRPNRTKVRWLMPPAPHLRFYRVED
jgi:hypothetical protein